MRSTTKLVILSALVTTTLLLTGCAPTTVEAPASTTAPTNTTVTATQPATIASGEPSSTTNQDKDVAAVNDRLKAFLNAAYSIKEDERSEVFAVFQTTPEWTDQNKKNLIGQLEKLMPELQWIGSSNVTWDVKAEAYTKVASYSQGKDQGITISIPDGATVIDGDTATVDMVQVTSDVTGTTENLATIFQLKAGTIKLTRIAGTWFFNAEDLMPAIH